MDSKNTITYIILATNSKINEFLVKTMFSTLKVDYYFNLLGEKISLKNVLEQEQSYLDYSYQDTLKENFTLVKKALLDKGLKFGNDTILVSEINLFGIFSEENMLNKNYCKNTVFDREDKNIKQKLIESYLLKEKANFSAYFYTEIYASYFEDEKSGYSKSYFYYGTLSKLDNPNATLEDIFLPDTESQEYIFSDIPLSEFSELQKKIFPLPEVKAYRFLKRKILIKNFKNGKFGWFFKPIFLIFNV